MTAFAKRAAQTAVLVLLLAAALGGGLPAAAQDAPPAATEDASPAAVGVVSGQIAHGTAGGIVPPGLPVSLFVFDPQFNRERFTATSDDQGRFRFDNVTIADGYSYAVTVGYRDRTFASAVARGSSASPALDLPVTIYELTEDPAVIRITGAVWQINAIADGLQVAQVLIFENLSDRLFTSSRAVSDTQFASVLVTLPVGAVVLGFPGAQDRYLVDSLQPEPVVIDTMPVVPGDDHVFQVVYFLPYNGGAIIEQPVGYPFQGAARLLLSPLSLSAAGDQFPAIGPQTVGESVYNGYGSTLNLLPGDVFRFELSGDSAPAAAQIETGGAVASNTLVIGLVGVAAGAAIAFGAAYTLTRRRRAPAAAPAVVDKNRLIDALTRQIAELDEAHDRGQINHDLYHHQRRQLKARLAQLIGEDSAPGGPSHG